VLFAFAGNQREKQHRDDEECGSNEENWGLKTRWKIGKNSIDPKEGEIGLGCGLDDGGIGLASGSEGAEEEGASDDGKNDCRSEDRVLPGGVGDEGDASFLGEGVVLMGVGDGGRRV
jgi:hypothetical protein